MRIITEEKMKMKRKHDNIIENLELCKKVAKDECYRRKRWRKKKIKEARGRNVTLKASSHIFTDTSNELLKDAEVKLSER